MKEIASPRLIENDRFPFEFLSKVAQRESWRKETFRPVYYLHKWWAKRLGMVFRGILLGSLLPENVDFVSEFYQTHDFSDKTVFDPFMGSGVTIGEAHKLGLTALGRDINPVAVESVRVSMGPLERPRLESAFETLHRKVGTRILELYASRDSRGNDADVLYYFWVMQTTCPSCKSSVDLFPSMTIAQNAYPNRKPEIQVLCPNCREIFPSVNNKSIVDCPKCEFSFSPSQGNAVGIHAICGACKTRFAIAESIRNHGTRPNYSLYGKLLLTENGRKEYLATDEHDSQSYRKSSEVLHDEVERANVRIPTLRLEPGYNTNQAMKYGFRAWRDFFNDRQLLALGWLASSIQSIEDRSVRDALFTIFSGTLEFQNLFTSYKGEGTGAVRHMFAHHILKPERTPIEANVWGTSKSSGSFSTLFRRRLLSAIEYRLGPTELDITSGKRVVCSPPFTGTVQADWPTSGVYLARGIYLSCGDSGESKLKPRSVNLVVTDPPFYDNVFYSELADFFYAWQRLYRKAGPITTRDSREVQDSNSAEFARKLKRVFVESELVLKDDGLFVFTYHHSQTEGWNALADAVSGAGLVVVNAHPVKSEMSVAAPKSQAKEPIQLDNILVCRKAVLASARRMSPETAIESARSKIERLRRAGLVLSRNDENVVYYGQLMTTLTKESGHENLSQAIQSRTG